MVESFIILKVKLKKKSGACCFGHRAKAQKGNIHIGVGRGQNDK